jgi:hypothetical protein
MRRAAIVAATVCLTAFIPGCGSETMTAIQPRMNVASSPSASVSRPIGGHCTTSYEVSDFVFLPPLNDDVLVSLIATHTGQCLMSHLGAATVVKRETVLFDAQGGHLVNGATTFRAANGDELQALESADLSFLDAEGEFSFTGSWLISDGTGRFAGASGRLDFAGAGSTVTSTTERSFQGRISY